MWRLHRTRLLWPNQIPKSSLNGWMLYRSLKNPQCNNLGLGNFGSSATWTLTKGQGYDIIFSRIFQWFKWDELFYFGLILIMMPCLIARKNVVNPINNTQNSVNISAVPQSSMTWVTGDESSFKTCFPARSPQPCNQLWNLESMRIFYCIYIDETRCEKNQGRIVTASVGDHFIEWRINAALPVNYLFTKRKSRIHWRIYPAIF